VARSNATLSPFWPAARLEKPAYCRIVHGWVVYIVG
jgi:hypothetical protein